MADLNYSNPGGMAPQIGWKPQGFLAGNMYYDQERDYRTSIDQSHALGNLSLLRKGAEYQDYMADAPVREAKRGFEIARDRAMAPIQGTLAGALGAEAQGRADVAPSNTETTKFKNAQHQRAAAEEKVSNYLGAVLERYRGDPMQAQLIWRDQIVPQLEREFGEKFPDQFKIMGPDQMAVVHNSLLQTSEHRRAILLQAQKDNAAMDRTRVDAGARVQAAEVRGDQTTSAELRDRQMQQYIAARTEQMVAELGKPTRREDGSTLQGAVTEEQMAQIRNRAMIEASELFYGGNPQGRAGAAMGRDENTDRLNRLRVEKISAPPVPDDLSKARDGQLYKRNDGTFWRRVTQDGKRGWLKVD